jgi:hypothetical protein
VIGQDRVIVGRCGSGPGYHDSCAVQDSVFVGDLRVRMSASVTVVASVSPPIHTLTSAAVLAVPAGARRTKRESRPLRASLPSLMGVLQVPLGQSTVSFCLTARCVEELLAMVVLQEGAICLIARLGRQVTNRKSSLKGGDLVPTVGGGEEP